MIKLPVNMSRYVPINRETAMRIAAAAARFHCTLTLEGQGVVLNLKSTIGLLSQSIPKDGEMMLVAVGEDEKQAVDELCAVISEATQQKG